MIPITMPPLRKTNPHLALMSDDELLSSIIRRALSSSRFEGARFSRDYVNNQAFKVLKKKVSSAA